MKVFDKIKNLFSKKPDGSKPRRGRYIGLALLLVGNAATITCATVAWFSMDVRESKIAMVSGDLDVEINKVTAYKYVYPYYNNSTEFIDYDSEGVVKKYILEDHVLTYDETDVDDISITSDNATITLGTKEAGTFTTNTANASYDNVCVPSTVAPAYYVPEFRYYLIGDSAFCGVTNSWGITDAFAFALRENVTNERPAIIDNVVVSAGSSFRLLETTDASTMYVYNYFPIVSISQSSSPFRVIDDDDDGVGDYLLCLRSGIYTFTYSPNQLSITLRTSNAKKDISVITNNSLDPTKISIDYAGSVNKTTYPTIDSYLSTAIYDQNTSLILDVELNFKNANAVDAGLQIERTEADSKSIYNLANKYADTTHNLVGYVDENHQNLLRASDFYNYYAEFTKTPYANTAALWTALHRVGDANSQKFSNGATYDRTMDCTLNLKELADSTVVDPINPDSGLDNIYHCYIVIEYDYEYSAYFLDKNRLGKTYLLDRDFGFHFFGVQHLEDSGE